MICFRFVLMLFLLSPHIARASENVRWQCLSGVVVETARLAAVVAAVQGYNLEVVNPQALDQVWESLPKTDPVILKVTTHPVVQLLDNVIDGVSRQGEALLMGANGGLVASTGKSSDFWQGDEPQFQEAIDLPPGAVYLQDDVADESTHSIQIRISAPVFDPASGKAIGVLMLGFDQFVMEFLQVCEPDQASPSVPK